MSRGRGGGRGGGAWGVKTHAAYDGVMTRQVGLAMLAAKDLVRVQVDIVCEPHPGHRSAALGAWVGMTITDLRNVPLHGVELGERFQLLCIGPNGSLLL